MNLKKEWKFGVFVLILSLSTSVYASQKKIGTSGAAFLKIGVGARPIGMAGAYAGVADDVNTAYWNPAGLGQINEKEFTFTHNSYFEDINYSYFGSAIPISKIGTFGLSVSYLWMGDLEKRAGDTMEPDSMFNVYDLAISLSCGREIYKDLFLGLNLKMIQQKIDISDATGVGVDIGVFWKTPLEKLNLGFVVQNIGPKIKFEEKGDPLPLNIKIGTSYRLLNDKLILAVDGNYPRDGELNISCGSEYILNVGNFHFPLRAGYKTGSDLGSIAGLRAGFGIGWNKYIFDFVWVPYGDDLGNTFRVSFLVKI